MDPFLAQLASWCRTHPTRAKWVFVPSQLIGRTLADRLVLDGADWANLRVVTPFDVALAMGAPFLVERQIDPSEEGLGPALVMRLLIELPGDTAYFRPLAGQPQLAMALWTTLRELRLAGITAEALGPDVFTSAGKQAELQALLGAYEEYLRRHARGDRATVHQEALLHPDWCPVQPQDGWTRMPDVIWSPLEERLFAMLPGEYLEPATLALPGAVVPRRLGNRPVGVDVGAPLARLMSPERGAREEAGAAARLSFFNAGGPEAEVEEVFRRILAAGAPLDTVEIVCATGGYPALVWEKACRYEWPVTLAAGLPALLTRPGRALVALTEWIEDDFAAGLFRRLLESGDVRLPDAVGVSPARAARLLVKAEAAWGRDTYRQSLGRLAASWRTRASRDEVSDEERDGLRRRADEVDALAGWIAGLVDEIPAADAEGRMDLQPLVACAERFIRDHAARPSGLDVAAARELERALAELRALGAFRCPASQALRFLRERVESVVVGVDRPRPGHLHVSTLADAGLSHRSQLFVIGLEEGRVFPPPFEDPILLDEERRRLGDALPRATDRTDEAVFAAIGRLASASAAPDVRVCFSYSCRDLRQFRETYASWLMLQAWRVASGDPDATYQALHAHLREHGPASCVPASAGAASSVGRWWLRGVTAAGEAAGRAAVLAAHPALAAGARAAEARASTTFTEWDGYVPEAGAVLDPTAPGAVVSPTRLEGAARCPFRFFLERGLRITAIESGERDREVWLDPLIRGSILHDLYADCLRRCRDSNRRADWNADREWLLSRGRARLAEQARLTPPPSLDVELRETRDLLVDLEVFLRAECDADPARVPVGFEVSFGQPDVVDAEPLASADPVTIAVGDLTFRLAGRVDRVDRVDAATGPAFRIIDYKTGGYWADDWAGTFAGGRLLQHALYGLAVTELLKRAGRPGAVEGAEYYFSSARGRQERKIIDAPGAARLHAVLADLRQVIVDGTFAHAPTPEGCKFCDFQHACGGEAHRRAEAKLGDPVLAPFVRLMSHE